MLLKFIIWRDKFNALHIPHKNKISEFKLPKIWFNAQKHVIFLNN